MKEVDSLKEALETENKLKENGGQRKGGQVLRKWREINQHYAAWVMDWQCEKHLKNEM